MNVLSILLYRALIPTKLELSQVSKIRHYCVVVETVKLFVCLFVFCFKQWFLHLRIRNAFTYR